VVVARAFAPVTAPRIAVARDGSHAVIVDGARAVAIRIDDLEPICEVALTGDAEVTWLSTALRLLIVAPTESHTDVRLVNPFGTDDARRVAEIRLEAAMRLGASNGTHALLLGARGAAVLAGGDTTVTPYQFLARTLPTVVGVAGTQFVVALPGTIEEWDPASRMPKRRLRLPRAAPITSLGGSDRVIWMTTQQEPARLDVLPIVNRGQPKAHELPEPIRSVHGHPHTDAVICIGAETGRVYAIDLDGRARLRTLDLPGIDRADAAALVVGRGGALWVIAAQAGRPIATAAIESREPETTSNALPAIARPDPVRVEPARPPLLDPTPVAASEPAPTRSRFSDRLTRSPAGVPEPRESPPRRSQLTDDPEPLITDRYDPSTAPAIDPESPIRVDDALVVPKQVAPTAWSEGAAELMSKLAALRAAGHEPGSPEAPQRASWRDDAGAWARAVASGTFDRAAPSCLPIDALAVRFELPASLIPALVLLYGSHLAGLDGAAPMDVAKVLGRRWDDALGRGKLAELGLAIYEHSRVKLAPAILRSLDELPPAPGDRAQFPALDD
jgi:hypothetical protein